MIFYLSIRSVSWAPTVCGELSATVGGDRCVTGATLNPVTVNTHHPHTHSPMHTQAHTHPHSHIHSHTCALTNQCTLMLTLTHSCSHIHAHTHTFPTLVHSHSHTPVHTHAHTHYSHTHAHILTHIHPSVLTLTYSHSHTYSHTHTYPPFLLPELGPGRGNGGFSEWAPPSMSQPSSLTCLPYSRPCPLPPHTHTTCHNYIRQNQAWSCVQWAMGNAQHL